MDSRIGTASSAAACGKAESLRIKTGIRGKQFVTGSSALMAAKNGADLYRFTSDGWVKSSVKEAELAGAELSGFAALK